MNQGLRELLDQTAITHSFSTVDYFGKPIFSSRSFQLAAAVSVVDEMFGAYLIYSYRLPALARSLIMLVLLVAIPLVLARTIIDHKKMQEIYAQDTNKDARKSLQMAAHCAEFYPFYTFFAVLLLLFGLILTAAQRAH